MDKIETVTEEQKCTGQKVIIRKIIKNNKLTMCPNL